MTALLPTVPCRLASLRAKTFSTSCSVSVAQNSLSEIRSTFPSNFLRRKFPKLLNFVTVIPVGTRNLPPRSSPSNDVTFANLETSLYIGFTTNFVEKIHYKLYVWSSAKGQIDSLVKKPREREAKRQRCSVSIILSSIARSLLSPWLFAKYLKTTLQRSAKRNECPYIWTEAKFNEKYSSYDKHRCYRRDEKSRGNCWNFHTYLFVASIYRGMIVKKTHREWKKRKVEENRRRDNLRSLCPNVTRQRKWNNSQVKINRIYNGNFFS